MPGIRREGRMKQKLIMLIVLSSLSSFTAYAQVSPAARRAPPTQLDAATGVIAGNVVTKDGRPVVGAVVLLLSGAGAAATHQLVADVQTDAAGQFTFAGTPGKSYHLVAGSVGYAVAPLIYDFTFAGGYASLTFVAEGTPAPTPAPLPKPCSKRAPRGKGACK